MKSVLKTYSEECREKVGLFPVWLPGTPMELGDVGTLSEGGWTRFTGLTELGIDFVERVGEAPWQHHLTSSVAISAVGSSSATAAEPLASLLASGIGFTLEFYKAGGFVFHVGSGHVHRIDNLHSVERSILTKNATASWNRDWVVVTEIVRAAPALICVAHQAGGTASIEFGAKSPLVDAGGNGGMSCRHDRGFIGASVTTQTSTVLWRGRYVNESKFTGVSMRERGTPHDQLNDWTQPPSNLPNDGDPYLAEAEEIDEILI